MEAFLNITDAAIERPMYHSDLAKWAKDHKEKIQPFLPVEMPGWIDKCKYYFPVQEEDRQKIK